jgi:TPR repeat protein
MDIEFSCRHCGQHLVVDDAGGGQTTQCPKCNQSLVIPSLDVPASAANPPAGGEVTHLPAVEVPAANAASTQQRLVQFLSVLVVALVFGLGIWTTFFRVTGKPASVVISKTSVKPSETPDIPTTTPQTIAPRTAFQELQAKAEEGDPQSQFEVACAYYSGQRGVTRNEVEAVKWYRKAAEQNYASAQYNLGFCYERGIGVTEDLVEAVKWYRKASDQNLAAAQHSLGGCYAKGRGVAKDETEGVKWYTKAAQQGNLLAQWGLARCYAEGKGVSKDMAEALLWYHRAVENKNLTGMEDIAQRAAMDEGCRYSCDCVYSIHNFGGNRSAKELVEAAKFLQFAAERGDLSAQSAIACCYSDGIGVTEDIAMAVTWYRKAADAGDVSAQKSLGDCYARGEGVPKSAAESARWYRKAAEQGDRSAQCTLAEYYTRGDGVPKDEVEAAK